MGDEVAHRLELDIARNSADYGAIDVKVDEGGEKAAGIHMRRQVAIGEGEVLGLLLVAIEDTGDAAFTADCAGGPLAGPATRGSLKLNDLGHCCSVSKNRT